MSIISSCPKCTQSVLLPSGVSASATVRCPLCQEQYSLQEVLGQLPPMLEVIDAGQPAVATAFAVPAAESHDDDMLLTSNTAFAESTPFAELSAFEESTPFAEQAAASPPYAQPAPGDNENDFGFAPMSDEIDEKELDPDEVDTVLDEERRPTITYGERLTGFDHGGSGFEPIGTAFGTHSPQLNGVNTYRAASTALDEDEIELDHEPAAEFEEEPAAEESAEFESMAVATKPRRRRREPSVIGNLIGVVGGGVVGLSLGYMILLWVGGPEKDFFGYSKNMPRWMLPPSFSEVQEEDPNEPKFATGFGQAPPQVAQNPNPVPNTPPKKKQPELGQELGEMQLNVPSLPSQPQPPQQTTTNKPIDGPLELTPPSETPAPPSLDLPQPDLGNPLIAPPMKTPKPKVPANPGGDTTLPVDPLKPESDLPIPPTEPVKPEMKNDVKPELPAATDTPKPEPVAVTETPKPAPPKTDDVPPPEENVGLKVPPVYTGEDLTIALTDARDVTKQLDDATAAGSEDVKKFTREFFVKLYKLCEVLTFVPANPDDLDLTQSRETAQQFILQVANDPAKAPRVNGVAQSWLNRPAKGDHDGLLATGVVQSTGKSGKMFETKVLLNGTERVITVLGAADPGLQKDDSVVVVGGIIENPGLKLFAYTAGEPLVIWNGLTLKLNAAQ